MASEGSSSPEPLLAPNRHALAKVLLPFIGARQTPFLSAVTTGSDPLQT